MSSLRSRLTSFSISGESMNWEKGEEEEEEGEEEEEEGEEEEEEGE